MEADWEFETGPDAAGLAAPVIETRWAGFVDLQREPARAKELPETAQLPELAGALARLNAPFSPVWTSKCDVWTSLKTGDFDPDELDAPPGCAAHAMGCYIDLLPRGDRQWLQPERAADDCKELCRILGAVRLRCGRADLVIRHALTISSASDPDSRNLGITAYLTSCGASQAEAKQALQAALAALVDALVATRS
ncbi:MAG: hypothetical protein ABR905_11585 [Terracidiphilus sp.]|jgi:hypothetical protein